MSKALPREEGLIVEALPGLTFRITLSNGKEILCHLAGKMRMNHIRVLAGDRVLVEISPDGRLGRIVRRI